MNAEQKKLLPLAFAALGSAAGDVVGYQKTGRYWSWPRFTSSVLGSGLGYAAGLTLNAVTPTDFAAPTPARLGVGSLGAVNTSLLLATDAVDPDSSATPLKLRRIEVVRGDGPFPNSPVLKIVALSTRQRAKRANKDVPDTIRNINRRYQAVVIEAANLHNVPVEVIITKLCIENPDLLVRVKTGSTPAIGLMQIQVQTAAEALRTEYRMGALTTDEAAYFRRKLGKRLDSIVASGRGMTENDLFDAELNIHLGTLAIGQYIRKYTDPATNTVYLHKAVANYNRGDRAEFANARTVTPDQLIAFKGPKRTSTPPTTQQYIMMYCGPNGPMDLLTRHKLTA